MLVEVPMKDRTLGQILRLQAERQPNKTFLIFEGGKTTYEEANATSSSVAFNLRRHGIRKGDHVAVFMNNHPDMLWTIFGLAMMGGIAVPLNTAAKGDQLLYFLEQSKASTLIVDEQLLPQITPILPRLQTVARLFVRAAETTPTLDWPEHEGRRTIDFRNLTKLARADEPLDTVSFGDVQLIMYTSGTTGPSKGVLCTHSQEQTGGRFMAEQMGYRESDVLYTCLPLFHANALRVTVNAALWAGATVALARRFSASQFWHDIKSSGATQFNALGAMANIILRQPASEDDKNHNVRLCNVVPVLPPEAEQEFSHRFGLTVTSLYGSTEACCPLFAVDMPADKGASCGRIVEPFEMKVVDENDFELPHGQVGEWLIRSREPWYIFQGYFDMPAETLATLRNGWFHSGDNGYRDEDGFYYFVDRKKESIRRRGENISSYEVELAISQHPAVLEVAAVPFPSDLGEDDVLVYVVLRQGMTITEEELIAFCTERMANFMVPRYIRFIEQLPKTPSEKIEKYKLRREAEDCPDLLWDRLAQARRAQDAGNC